MKQILIVGYGNTLRRDDGLGPHIVEALSARQMPPGIRVRGICLPQLDVTLVPEIAGADVVLFVDARADEDDCLVKTCAVAADCARPEPLAEPHAIRISTLVTLARAWYGRRPACHCVWPKGFDFSFGETLSSQGEKSAERAMETIIRLLAAA